MESYASDSISASRPELTAPVRPLICPLPASFFVPTVTSSIAMSSRTYFSRRFPRIDQSVSSKVKSKVKCS